LLKVSCEFGFRGTDCFLGLGTFIPREKKNPLPYKNVFLFDLRFFLADDEQGFLIEAYHFSNPPTSMEIMSHENSGVGTR